MSEVTKKEERLAKLRELRAKEVERHESKLEYYDNLIATWEAKGDKMAGVEFKEGDVVKFTHGRPGHQQREVEGTVIGFKEFDKAGVFAVIQAGEGVDTEIIRCRPSAVFEVVSSASVEEEEQVEEQIEDDGEDF
jgi:hypothetical protein